MNNKIVILLWVLFYYSSKSFSELLVLVVQKGKPIKTINFGLMEQHGANKNSSHKFPPLHVFYYNYGAITTVACFSLYYV